MQVQVLVNQVGYLPNSVKKVVVQAMSDGGKKGGSFEVLKTSEVVYSGVLEYAGELWGRHYWLGDFTPFSTTGEHRIKASVGGVSNFSYPFVIGADAYDKPLHLASRFFYYQRCGSKVEGWHEPCHLDDAYILSENRHIDAVGGWHDAGDLNKWGGDAHTTYALVTTYEKSEGVLAEHFRESILEEARWGAEYLIKMITPDGGLYRVLHEVDTHGPRHWTDPSKNTDNVIGTADDRLIDGVSKGTLVSQFASAALAKLARLMAKTDPSSSQKYRDSAERLWITPAGKMSVYDMAAHLLADIELYKLTANPKYSYDALKTVTALLNLLPEARNIAWNEITMAGLPYAALVLWLETLSDKTDQSIITAVRYALELQNKRLKDLSDNPFGIVKFYAEVEEKTEYSWFMPRKLERYAKLPGKPPGYKGPLHYQRVGLNSYYASFAWSLMLYASYTGDRNWTQMAQRLLDWILGANPLNLCMLQRAGSNNPPRLCTAMATITGHEDGRIPGAVPNGIDRPLEERSQPKEDDTPYFDMRSIEEAKRSSYHSTEVWLPNNATFILALSELLTLFKTKT